MVGQAGGNAQDAVGDGELWSGQEPGLETFNLGAVYSEETGR